MSVPAALGRYRVDALDTDDPDGLRRASEGLLREARAAAALKHPDVVAIHDLGMAEDGQPFVVMELVEGRLLRAFVGARDVPVATRVHWLAGIARALGAAHGAGLVHRDIKPENVMIDVDGTAKVLDFGIARPLRAPASTRGATLTGGDGLASQVAGTPLYMAPELLAGLHPMATGTWPPRLGGRPPRSCDELAPVPPAVAVTVMRTMAAAPEHRLASMRDIVGVLDAFLAYSVPPPPPAPLPAAAPPPALRGPMIVDPSGPTQPAVTRDAVATRPTGRVAARTWLLILGASLAAAAGAVSLGLAMVPRSETTAASATVGSERLDVADPRHADYFECIESAGAFARRVRPGAWLTSVNAVGARQARFDVVTLGAGGVIAQFQFDDRGEARALTVVVGGDRLQYLIGGTAPRAPTVATSCTSKDLWEAMSGQGVSPEHVTSMQLGADLRGASVIQIHDQGTMRLTVDANTCKVTQRETP